MKVKTGLNAGYVLRDAADQAKLAAASTVRYLRNTRNDVVDFASSEVNKLRSAWQSLASL